MVEKNWTNLVSYSRVKLRGVNSNIDPGEFVSECYIYLLSQVSEGKEEVDYLKLGRRWIMNQSYWSSRSKLPKSEGKNIKSKLRNIGGEGDMSIFEDLFECEEVDLDWKIEYGLWVEGRLDRPEKVLLKLHFIDGLSINKIRALLLETGVKVSSSSIYLQIRKLKEKLKLLYLEWERL